LRALPILMCKRRGNFNDEGGESMSKKLKRWITRIGKDNTPNPFANGKVVYFDDIAKIQKRISKKEASP